MLARFQYILLLLSLFLVGQTAQAQVTEAAVKSSVGKATAYLLKELGTRSPSGETSLAAYACIKAGESPRQAAIQKVVTEVAQRAAKADYKPINHGVYAAGVELMLLEAADPVQYRTHMENVVGYLVKSQYPNGSWDYENDFRGGDTSQCQYALLGFWAAERAGIDVPDQVWDKAAQWFLRNQARDGGFAYHPSGKPSPPDNVVSHGMSAAGAGGLMIIRMHLYPHEVFEGVEPPKPPQKKFGVLQKVDLDQKENPDGSTAPNPGAYQPTVSSTAIQDSAKRAFGWVASRFTVSGEISSTGHVGPYYLYTLERMAALFNADAIAGRNWFAEGAAYLMKTQTAEGVWKSAAGDYATTSLGVLFLMRTTAKTLGRQPNFDPLGTGLLAGGRGLPDDLNAAVMKDGKVEEAKDLGPIDQLLAELEKVETVDIAATQEAIIEQVQLGDREELIKQKDYILKLAKHPSPEVRRTAVWALGRTEDLKMAKILMAALEDNDIDVAVEARNALCILSRQPLGFGLPESPFANLPENAPTADRDKALVEWRKALKEKWGNWFYKYRPYEERDDLQELNFRTP